MKRMFTPIVGLSVGLSILANPAIALEPTPTAKAEKAKPTLEDFIGEVKLPELFIGSTAPKLQIAKFVKGDSVDGFESGQVYVVEFWATWCGPCIAAFPHLSELQKEQGEKVKFIGVNVWERDTDQAERIQKVEDFVAKQGDRMSYTVAVEDNTAMADTWMGPAGQNGIPAAFIVDGTGHIAWIGHPSQLEEPLDQVLAGKFDPATAAADAKKQMVMMAGYTKFAQSIQSGENIDEARQIADILISDYFADEPQGLNAIAWMLLNADSSKVGEPEYKVAHRAIALACEKTAWKDWSLLDTYALSASKMGHKDEAVKWEKKAIELAPADNTEAIAELKANLKKFEAQG